MGVNYRGKYLGLLHCKIQSWGGDDTTFGIELVADNFMSWLQIILLDFLIGPIKLKLGGVM